jgi:hypothetical protein
MAADFLTEDDYKILGQALLKAERGPFSFEASDKAKVAVFPRTFFDTFYSGGASLAVGDHIMFADGVNENGKTRIDTNNPGKSFGSRTAFFLMGISVEIFTKQGASAELVSLDVQRIRQYSIAWFDFREREYFDQPLADYPDPVDGGDFRSKRWLGIGSFWIPPQVDRFFHFENKTAISLTASSEAAVRVRLHGYYVRPIG